MRRLALALACGALGGWLVPVAPLAAQGLDLEDLSLTIHAGQEFPVLGELTQSASTPAFTETITDDDGNEVETETFRAAEFQSLDWGDAFENFRTLGAELDFWEDSRRSLYLGASFTRAKGQNASLGTYDGADVRADFSDYKDTSFYAGFRWGESFHSLFKSLLSLQVGATVVDDISARVDDIPELNTLTFYKRSTVFEVGGLVSFLLTPTDFLEAGVQTGLTYQTAVSGNDQQLSELNLSAANGAGALGFVPVRALLRIRY